MGNDLGSRSDFVNARCALFFFYAAHRVAGFRGFLATVASVKRACIENK